MRRPQNPDEKNPPDDHPPPGGRAWQRVRDFERARGLPAESTPHTEDGHADTDPSPPAPKKKDDR